MRSTLLPQPQCRGVYSTALGQATHAMLCHSCQHPPATTASNLLSHHVHIRCTIYAQLVQCTRPETPCALHVGSVSHQEQKHHHSLEENLLFSGRTRSQKWMITKGEEYFFFFFFPAETDNQCQIACGAFMWLQISQVYSSTTLPCYYQQYPIVK